uniref:Prenyltransferase alpha-alpha toroid domain-containing protein n=1 Tax=Chenopodium quinoa TaxID=63459 RepID=A0A803N069_CHEQI
MASKLTQPFSIDPSFDKDRHVRFLDMMYELLPSDYESQEINHLTLAYFTLSSLDILGALDRVDKEAIVAWVLSFQAHKKDQDDLRSGQFYGFLGSRSSQFPADALKNSNCNSSHLASTYSALAILKILGYDFSLFDSESILRSMRNLQQSDGSHMMVALVYVLVWNPMAFSFLVNIMYTYDTSDTGGATYCAIASLRLMGFIEDDLLSKGVSSSIIDIPVLLDWMMQRQAADGGFQGRLNKPSDTCYAFWVGGVLKILGGSKFVNKEALRDSLLTCQSVYGGFSKFPGELPELYHSYYGFSAYSLLEEPTLNSLCVELGITKRAASGS